MNYEIQKEKNDKIIEVFNMSSNNYTYVINGVIFLFEINNWIIELSDDSTKESMEKIKDLVNKYDKTIKEIDLKAIKVESDYQMLLFLESDKLVLEKLGNYKSVFDQILQYKNIQFHIGAYSSDQEVTMIRSKLDDLNQAHLTLTYEITRRMKEVFDDRIITILE